MQRIQFRLSALNHSYYVGTYSPFTSCKGDNRYKSPSRRLLNPIALIVIGAFTLHCGWKVSSSRMTTLVVVEITDAIREGRPGYG